MEFSTIIGSLGVTILLVAFFLNLFGFLHQENKLYAVLNVIGAGISCYASILISYTPFIILEGCWSAVAFIGLLRQFKTKS